MDFINELITEDKRFDDVLSRVKSAERGNERRRDTKGFALENDNGSLIKVFVKDDQADDFERALGQALNFAEKEGIEVSEILFELRKNFDIVDVDWGEGSIPEDEEVDNKLKAGEAEGDDEEAGGDDDADDSDFDDLMGDEEGGDEDLEPEEDLDGELLDAEGGSDETEAYSALSKVIDAMSADADARKAEADARKAEAELKISEETNRAANTRAEQEEEILDMEKHNTRKDEDKKAADTRAKMIRYRHETSKLGESTNMKYSPATPEEEEILDMEDHNKSEKDRDDHKKTRAEVNQYRHDKKKGKGKSKKAREEEEIKGKIYSDKELSFADFFNKGRKGHR